MDNILHLPPRIIHEDEVEAVLARRAPSGGETAPTPQRVARAIDHGETVIPPPPDANDETWKVSPPLDDLLRRGTIDEAEHAAACRFLREYYLGVYAGPRTTGYQERIPGGGGKSEEYMTRRIHYAREVEKAIHAIDPLLHRVVLWMVSTLADPLPLATLGEYYAPTLSKQTQSSRGGQVLATTCAMLCRHYGLQHRLTIEARLSEMSSFLRLGR